MQFLKSVLPCALLLLQASAAPVLNTQQTIAKRDLSGISGILNVITADLAKLDTAVNGFDGDTIKAVPVLEAADQTLKDLASGLTQMQSQTELGLVESIGVLLPVGALYSAAKQVVTDIKAKKDLFDKAGVSFVVQDKLGEFQTSAGKLVDVTIKKIPAYLSILSTPIAGSITGQLDDAAVFFGLKPGPQPGFASLTDVASSLGSAFSSLSSSTSSTGTTTVTAPAPAKSSSSGFSLSSLFG